MITHYFNYLYTNQVCVSASIILISEFDNRNFRVNSLPLNCLKWFARGNTLEGLWANPSLFKC